MACEIYPTAGTVAIEYQLAGSALWVPILPTTAIAGIIRTTAHGPVARYRFTLAGITGAGRSLRVRVERIDAAGFPDGAFLGTRALTTQPYTEANVKNGVQFYTRAVWPLADPIVSGPAGARKLWFKTGAKTIIVKSRELIFVAEEMTIRLFRAPTGVAGGTDLQINNFNGINPVATTVQAKKNVTTTTNGVEFGAGDPEYGFGEAQAVSRSQGVITLGRERILPANTEFLVVIENLSTGGASARASYLLDWYEGPPDLPQ